MFEMGDFIYKYLIEGVYLAVLLIVLVRLFAKKIVSTDWTIQFMRWAMILYAVSSLIDTLIYTFSNETLADLQKESTGYHETLFFFVVLLKFAPFILLDYKIGKNLLLLFGIGLLLNIQSFALIYIWSLREYSDNMHTISDYGTELISRVSIVFISVLAAENGLKAWMKYRRKI
jgi:hypothetical protein